MGALDRAFEALGSVRSSALLSTLLAGAALVSGVVPQGKTADDLARAADAADLHRLAAWGLTDIYTSNWFYALLVLLAGNALAFVILQRFGRSGPALPDKAPAKASAKASALASRPERALEEARAVLISALGAPVRSSADGAKAELVFDSGAFARRAPLLLHFAIVTMVLGAALFAREQAEGGGVAHGVFTIFDRQTRTTGHFDIVAGEPFTFFQYPTQWVLRDYVPSRDGLGPAVRFQRAGSAQEMPREVWIYLNAPPGFDERHRADDVAITAQSLRLEPLPGRGLSASAGGPFVALGLALVVLALAAQSQPAGRVFVRFDGDEVELIGVALAGSEDRFARAFSGWAKRVERAIASYA